MMQRSFKKEITDESLKKEMTKEFLSYYSKNIDKDSTPTGVCKISTWAKSKVFLWRFVQINKKTLSRFVEKIKTY